MKAQKAVLAILVLAVTGLTLGACSDDEEQGSTTNQETTADVGHDTDDDQDVTDDLDVHDGDDDDVTDDSDVGEAEDVQDEEDAAVEDFGVDPVECAFPASDPACEAGNFGPGSMFSEIVIETRGEEDACCFDLSGDTIIDNFIGEDLVAAITGVEGFADINQNIVAAIGSGEMVYIMETIHWLHPEWSNLDMRVYQGGTTQYSMEQNLAGIGGFNITPTNFDDQGQPRFGFENVEVRDGVMTAKNGTIELTFPGLVEAIAVELGAVQFEANVELVDPAPDLTAGGGFALTDGRLGGAIMRDRFFRTLNEESLNCDCLELDDFDSDNVNLWTDGLFTFDPGHGEFDGDDFIYDEGDNVAPGRWVCEWKASGGEACQDPSEPAECRALGDLSLCSILSGLSNQTDVWIDGEPGFSLGVHFETVPVEITGIDPQEL